MNQKKIDILIEKLIEDRLSEKESVLLINWLQKEENEAYFNEFVEIKYLLNLKVKFNYKQPLEKAKINLIVKSPKGYKVLLKYAAAVIIIVATGYFLTNDKLIDDSASIINNNIEIGTDKATLTLEDGSTVALEKGKQYESDKVTSDGEKIIYDSLSDETKEVDTEIAFNYLTVPRGGEFYIELADATKVWLNSESQIKYPVSFISGKTRQVEILYGEAYFEVSPSSNHNGASFKVVQNNQTVEVLGTEFNIKAYKDENQVSTTLVEGRVVVEIENNKKQLSPNEQLSYNLESNSISVENVNTANVIAWREGFFFFENTPLSEAIKTLSRWYNVDFEVNNKTIESIKLKGTISKNQNIENILITLKNLKNISYEITENKIYLN